MKIWLISDTHYEMQNVEVETPDEPVDVIVAAGDIDSAFDAPETLASIRQDYADQYGTKPEIVYVAGNHEYYLSGDDLIGAEKELHRECRKYGINFLSGDKSAPSKVVIDGVRFIGATLWGDCDRGNPLSCMKLSGAISDFNYIRYEGRRFRPEDMYRLNQRDRRAIEQALCEQDEDSRLRAVVVTHHLPAYKCVAEPFLGSMTNGAFVSDMDDLIAEYAGDIALWLFGHSHIQTDTQAHGVPLISQPGDYGVTHYKGRVIDINRKS